TPGITIRDRLRVLLPEDPESYYRTRELLPSDLVGEIGKAKIVLTNYHAFKRRETMDVSKVGRSLLQGRGEAPVTTETEGQKLPRVPVADNLPSGDMPMYRNLWENIGKRMPKKGRGKSGKRDPLDLPSELQTALHALYGHYVKVFEEWNRAGVDVPPVFIVVC